MILGGILGVSHARYDAMEEVGIAIRAILRQNDLYAVEQYKPQGLQRISSRFARSKYMLKKLYLQILFDHR